MLALQIAQGEGNARARDLIVRDYRTAKARELIAARLVSRNLLERMGPTKTGASKKA